MSKVLSLPNGQNSVSVYTSDGSAEVILLGVDPSSIAFASPGVAQASEFSGFADNSVVSVGVVNDLYRLSKSPPAGIVADGVNVIAPAAPAGALLFRKYTTNQEAWSQTAWFVDPVNGSDANDGATAPTALKTLRELGVRWNRGRLTKAAYTVTVAAGDVGKMGAWDIDIGPGTLVTIAGTLSSTAPRAIATVTATNIATNTRGAITDAGGAFARGQRLRLVSGTQTGALTYCQGGTVAASAVVSGWSQAGNLAPPGGATFPSIVEPTAGDQYVTDTFLTTVHIGAQFTLRGPGRLALRDLNWTVDPASSFAEFESFQISQSQRATIPMSPQLFIYGCQFDSNGFCGVVGHGGPVNFGQCIFRATTSLVYGACAAFNECVFQSSLTVGFFAFMQFVTRLTFDGGSMIVKSATFESNGGSIQAGATAAGGNCIEFLANSYNYWHGGGRLWGPTSGYAVGVRVHAFAGFMWDATSLPTLTGSTTADCVWQTANFTWAGMLTQAATAPTNLVGGLLVQGVA
jgi:hypothetical protein